MGKNKFAIDIAKYFMDFLETNFHKRKAPKRSFKSKNDKNLLVGINLRRFPRFQEETLSMVGDSFKKLKFTVKKGQYTKRLSGKIQEYVVRYCDGLLEKDLMSLNDDIKNKAKLVIEEPAIEIDDAKEKISDLIAKELDKTFIAPLIDLLADPMQRTHSFEEDLIIGLEDEILSTFIEKIDTLSSEFVISNIVEKNKANLNILDLISLDQFKKELIRFFEALQVDDLFFEINELLSNKEIIEKQEFYFYFIDLKFEQSNYPLFYIPAQVSKTTNAIEINLDSSVYINKKAVEFIIQRINEYEGRKGKIQSIGERKIYINEQDLNPLERVESIVNEILNYIKVESNWNTSSTKLQIFRSTNLQISNNSYLALFDKSDESLINDYEELLELLSGQPDVLGEKFNNLLQSFLKEEPVKVISEVEKEWDNESIPKKLVNVSPIPLNEQQNQIVKAINKGKM